MPYLNVGRGTVLYANLTTASREGLVTSVVLPVFNKGITKIDAESYYIGGEKMPLPKVLGIAETNAPIHARLTISYPDGTAKQSDVFDLKSISNLEWDREKLDAGLDGRGGHAFLVLGRDGSVKRVCDPATTTPCGAQ